MSVRGTIRVGTSSWADRTLLESGWYPKDANTPEKRLAYYASRFPVVEVDSTYYAPPSERNAALWVERTPADFTFNVKAFALMTGHPAPVRALPKDLRAAAGERSRVYPKDLPGSAVGKIWDMFRSALMPLHSAGKLGFVLFQFPEWFVPSKASKDEILRAAERLSDFRIAVEFRRRSWMDSPEQAERTLRFLSDHDLVYVGLDMPQGFDSSLPPVVAATSESLAVIRFHGRNEATWRKKGITAAERFDYLYSERELREWVPKVTSLADQAREVHAMFNNCYRDKGVRSAQTMLDLLTDA